MRLRDVEFKSLASWAVLFIMILLIAGSLKWVIQCVEEEGQARLGREISASDYTYVKAMCNWCPNPYFLDFVREKAEDGIITGREHDDIMERYEKSHVYQAKYKMQKFLDEHK